jgi:hypothetical protein
MPRLDVAHPFFTTGREVVGEAAKIGACSSFSDH